MKLSELFNETKWGWATRGEAPPAAKPKPEVSPEEQRRIHDTRIKDKQRRKARRAWMPETDVADELLQKQADARRARHKASGKFFPED
jgi:hypothetical protein